MRRLLVTLPLALIFITKLQAQEPCRDNETIAECQTRLANPQAAKPVAQKVAADAVNQENRQKPTPIDSSGSITTSSVKDFLPLLAVALQSVSIDQKKQELVIDYNLPSSISPKGFAIQVQSVVRQPQLYEPVRKQLPATDADTLAAGLGDLSDVTVAVTVGLQNRRFGRRLTDNNDIFISLFEASTQKAEEGSTESERLRAECTRLSQQIAHKQSPDPTFADYAASGREQLRSACTQDAIARAALQDRRVQELKATHIGKLASLLNNQPQLVFSVNHRLKNELVGPDENAAQLSWEWSSQSLNAFRQKVETERLSGEGLIKTFQDFGVDADRAGRAKLLVQYTSSDHYTLKRQANSLNLDLSQANRFTASLTYGKPVLFDGNGKESGRIDLAGQYDNFSDDPKHKDRGTASFTYTQKLNKDLSLPIGIVYANHDQFLGEVQKRFSAHFGLKLKLPFGS